MCFSVSITLTERKQARIEHDFVVKWQEDDRDLEYFVASGFSHPQLPVVTSNNEFKKLRWGLIPGWVKDWKQATELRVMTLNAQGETIGAKPAFRGAVKQGNFCVVPVDGFFEWHHLNKEKYPHFIYPKDDGLFYFGGLFENWVNLAIDEQHHTFTIVTTPANPRMEWIHNAKKRMPLILTAENAKIWLDTTIPFEQKKDLIRPLPETLMADHAISRLINSRKENPNQKKVLEPCEYPELLLQ